MNHCIEAVCVHCGYTYCLLGCGGHQYPVDMVAQAYKQLLEDKKQVHHYASHVCRQCGQKALIAADAIEREMFTIKPVQS